MKLRIKMEMGKEHEREREQDGNDEGTVLRCFALRFLICPVRLLCGPKWTEDEERDRER